VQECGIKVDLISKNWAQSGRTGLVSGRLGIFAFPNGETGGVG
jgi:hypothetical protein